MLREVLHVVVACVQKELRDSSDRNGDKSDADCGATSGNTAMESPPPNSCRRPPLRSSVPVSSAFGGEGGAPMNAASHLQQQQHGMTPPPMPREAQRRKTTATATATTGAVEFGLGLDESGTSRSTPLRSNSMGTASASASASALTAKTAGSQQQVLRHRILNRIQGPLHVPPFNADGDNNGVPATVSQELIVRHSIMDRISRSNDTIPADADADGGATPGNTTLTMNLPRPDSRPRRSSVPASFGGGAVTSTNTADYLQQQHGMMPPPREAQRRKTIATATATTEAAEFDHSSGTASASASASTTKTAASQQVLRHRILNRIHGQSHVPPIKADGGKNGTPLTVSRELVRHRIMHRIHSQLRPINEQDGNKKIGIVSRSIAPTRFLPFVLGLAVVICIRLIGRTKDPPNLATDLAKRSLRGGAGKSPETTSVAASPLSRQDPWALALGRTKQKGANSSSAGGGSGDEKDEAYMPAHLAELLVRDGVPKEAAGPQSF